MSTTERDELAKVIVAAYGEDAEAECPCEQDIEVADAILAAGYSKPRQVTTVEELDAMGRGTAVLDANRRVWTNDGFGLDQWGCVHHDEYPQSLVWRGSASIALPATVLHVGGVE